MTNKERGQLKREIIIKAARKLLLDKGLYNWALKDIAEFTSPKGINQGNFYYFFKTKDQLVKEAVPEYVSGQVQPKTDQEQRLALEIKLHNGRIR